MPEQATATAEQQPENTTASLDMSNHEGARKAAIVMVMLGHELAREVLREMSDDEVETLLKVASELRNVETDEALGVLEEYTRYFDGRTLLVPEAKTFVRTIAEETLGADKVRDMLGIEEEETQDEQEMIQGADPDAIARVLRKEHPQTVAIALAAMQAETASAVVSKLPEEQRPEVVRRMAELKSLTPDLLREIGETLRRELEASAGSAKAIDGQDVVVALLKLLTPEEEEAIFAALSEDDPELSEEIRKKMFVFEDFITIDGRGIQLMLKEVDGRTLTLALKTSSTPLREHILSCMSSRAATMILEDLEALGPVSVSQVEAAQDEIVQVALRLASEGKLNLR